MNDMQQRVYRPPNVAGWEGGMSWLNTNTVQGRFDLITRAQYLKYSNYYDRRRPPATYSRPTSRPRRREAAFDRAYDVRQPAVALRRPRATTLIAWATAPRPTNTAAQRRQRFYALQALMLGGPDGQVM